MTNPDTTLLDNSLLPTPGSTKRTKTTAAPTKKKKLSGAPKPEATKKARPRKLLTAKELTIEENNYAIKYPHINPGSFTNATKGQPIDGLTDEEVIKYNHKRSCIITCQTEGCTTTRRVATSDLAQVHLCETCTKNARNQRKRERRANAKTKKE